MNKDNKIDIYQNITNRIIGLLESHQANEFEKTWFSACGEIFASNPLSKASYNGLNQLLLSFFVNDSGYTQNRWLTLKQGNSLGAKVKKGQHAWPVIFYSLKYIDRESKKNITEQVLAIQEKGNPIPQNAEKIPILKNYLVFNLDQFENLPENVFFKGESLTFTEPDKDDLAEDILNKTGAKIEFKRFQETAFTALIGNTANFYNPIKDIITLAERAQFKSTEGFYRTAFHELGHWTGHQTRMNRLSNVIKGSKEYALEELTAELFTAFMCARLGFNSQITNNAAYIKSWLKALADDNKFIFKAAGQAEKAVDYVCDLVQFGVVLKPENIG